MCTEQTTFKLTDEAIGMIAKKVQLAILTGTDVVDHLRQMQLTKNDDNTLQPTDNYSEQFEQNIATMLEQLATMQAQEENVADETAVDGFGSVGDSPFEL